MGNAELVDAMIHDGLWDIYGGQSMGTYGDRCAGRFGFTRQEQDDFAVRSHTRARRAIEEGAFADEIVPVEVVARGKASLVTADEGPNRFDEPKLRGLQAGVPPRGDDHRRQRVEHQRRRRGAPDRLAGPLRRTGLEAAGQDRRCGDLQPGAGLVHDRPDRRDPETPRRRRLVGRGRRPVRDQRGVRRGHDGGRARAGTCRRRRSTFTAARSPWATRSVQRGANPRDPVDRAGTDGRPSRGRQPLHRRRRGRRDGRRDRGLMVAQPAPADDVEGVGVNRRLGGGRDGPDLENLVEVSGGQERAADHGRRRHDRRSEPVRPPRSRSGTDLPRAGEDADWHPHADRHADPRRGPPGHVLRETPTHLERLHPLGVLHLVR